MLAPQMRLVQLTPMMPLAIPTEDEQSRRNVFLALKAASIVIAKLQADTQQFVENKTTPALPLTLCTLPCVTEIKAFSTPESPSPSPPRISFTLVRRYDDSPHQNLYLAQLNSTGEEIHVKFTQR